MHRHHLFDHIKDHSLESDSTLHVIGVISNPERYNSRFRLYRQWIAEMEKTANVKVYTVEAAYGDRRFEVTERENPQHLQIRTKSEIWLKENMINLGVRHLLGPYWKYMSWVDCDVFFRDPNWALETIHQLQHFPVVQPWQSAVNLGFKGRVLETHESFGYKSQKGFPANPDPNKPYWMGHTGYAWAATRAFYEGVNGLIDFAILGSGDHQMAKAMIGLVNKSFNGAVHESFLRRCEWWQRNAMRHTNGQVGYVQGRVEHNFHGPMTRRGYGSRWKILEKHAFDPDNDLIYDSQGAIQLINKPGLEHDILQYNRSRYEDSIEEY